MSRTIALGAGLVRATVGGTRAPIRRPVHRPAALFVVVIGLIAALAAPTAAATDQISGVGVLDSTNTCSPPPTGYESFTDFTIVMSGSLVGCWYTDILTTKDNGGPSGVYQERGEEIFVGHLVGHAPGTFTTTYMFASKWDPDVSTGSEVHGSCHHPIAAGSGTGGFQGATGRLDFKDDVLTGDYDYRGHISLR
jgi:hypothetical protein